MRLRPWPCQRSHAIKFGKTKIEAMIVSKVCKFEKKWDWLVQHHIEKIAWCRWKLPQFKYTTVKKVLDERWFSFCKVEWQDCPSIAFFSMTLLSVGLLVDKCKFIYQGTSITYILFSLFSFFHFLLSYLLLRSLLQVFNQINFYYLKKFYLPL